MSQQINRFTTETQRGQTRDIAVYPEQDLTKRIIGAAIEVHRAHGPGLLESAYEACFCRELKMHEIAFTSQLPLPVTYKGERLDCGYRIDVLVEERAVVEL
jgi:GxxExxY protein